MNKILFVFNAVILLFVPWLAACSNTASMEIRPAAETAPPARPGSVSPQIEAAQKLIAGSPGKTKGYTQLAVAYIRLARETGDFSLNTKAETALERALQIDPADVAARKLGAALQLTFHRFDEALEAGRKLRAEFPNDDFVYGILTDANVELGKYSEAVDAAQKMVDLKPNMSSYARIAHLRSLHGDHPGAVEMFRLAARTADPLDKEAQSWCLVQLGDELWKNGKYLEAERVFDEALQNFPDYHLALAGKGRARAAQNDPEAALTLLTAANNRSPNVETMILVGDIHAKQGDGEKAKEQYEMVGAIEQRLGNINDRKRLALMWADHDQNLDQALAIARREAELRQDIFTADVLAWCLYKNGQLTDAKTAIARALNLKSNEARILFHAGMIEKDLGNSRAAVSLLERALKLNPMFDLRQAPVARQALSELR